MLIENIIPKKYQDEIETVLNSKTFPWYYMEDISPGEWQSREYTESSAICHTLFNNEGIISDYFPVIKPILYFLDDKTGIIPSRILRIRIRRTVQTPGHTSEKYNRPHIDLPEPMPFTTLVYYADETDGDTILFNEKYRPGFDPDKVDLTKLTEHSRISPKKGSGLVFDGWQYHAGNNPVNYKKRTIINFDFVEEK